MLPEWFITACGEGAAIPVTASHVRTIAGILLSNTAVRSILLLPYVCDQDQLAMNAVDSSVLSCSCVI